MKTEPMSPWFAEEEKDPPQSDNDTKGDRTDEVEDPNKG